MVARAAAEVSLMPTLILVWTLLGEEPGSVEVCRLELAPLAGQVEWVRIEPCWSGFLLHLSLLEAELPQGLLSRLAHLELWLPHSSGSRPLLFAAQ